MYLLKRYSEQCFISDCSLQEALFIYYYNTKKLSVTPDDTLSNLKCDSYRNKMLAAAYSTALYMH